MKCFVIALESEAQPVLKHMVGAETKKVHNKTLWTGNICGEKAAVLICGVGKVNAACGAQYAIDELEADVIINIGLAGALNNGCAVGSVYEIEKAVQYDFDLVQLNGTPIGTLNEFDSRWLTLNTSGIFPVKSLATGDRFNDSKEDYRLLTGDIGADIRDMEGAAIAQVCIHAGVKLYSYKVISDIAGSGSTTDQYIANTIKCAASLDSAAESIFKAAV